MNKERTMRQILLVSGMLALLIMSFLFDFVTGVLQIRNSQGLGLEPYLVILFPLFEMRTVFGGLGLFWYVLANRVKAPGVTLAFILVGILILYGMPLLFFLPVPITWLAAVDYIQPGTYVFQSGAVLAVTGILAWLIKDRAHSKEEPVEAPDLLA
jgi:hypothetical protein